MVEQNGHIAILIDVMRDEQGIRREPGVRLYQSLTCNGSLGPSEILFLAFKGVKYSDDEPTLTNVRDAFLHFTKDMRIDNHCIIWIRSNFDQDGVYLLDGMMSSKELSGIIDGLDCITTDIILDGPGSDQVAKALGMMGKRVLYSERSDGANKIMDPLDVPSIFQGDRISLDLVFAERQRLEREGYHLHWLERSEDPKNKN